MMGALGKQAKNNKETIRKSMMGGLRKQTKQTTEKSIHDADLRKQTRKQDKQQRNP